MTTKTIEAVASLGGKARAEQLSPDQRTEIAKKAAVARWGARATHAGTLRIGDLELDCAVLEDGRRVLSQRGINRALGRSQGGKDYRRSEGAGELPVFLALKGLEPFISNELRALGNSPVIYRYEGPGGAWIAHGLEATSLPLICEAWLKARDAGALKAVQLPTARAADAIVRGLAQVGIIALVDEATGYQEIRDKRALQEILEKYLLKEFAVWAKRFPDEFYKQIFRLRCWEWRGMRVGKPSAVANYTNNVVYERLAPGILAELEKRNPAIDGRRRARHHQLLTEDIGHPALAQHLHAVMGLMRASPDWDTFMRLLDAAFPKKGETLALFPGLESAPAPRKAG